MSRKINHVRISLRLEPALHKRLQAQAQHERRSLHGQIVWLLEHMIPAPTAMGPLPDHAPHPTEP
jgi:hypothetical protein